MVSPGSRTVESVPCDFCSERTAVLHCRADSARLCLFCDQYVHSANLLSRKHTRSQICDNCGTEPASIRCSSDNLVLCQECDSDAHGGCPVSASHDRTPIEGFSGCPSAVQLAALWGLDLDDEKPSLTGQGKNSLMQSIVFGFQELIAPGEDPSIFSDMSFGEIFNSSKRQNPSCGRYKQAIHEQLLELSRQDIVGGDGGGGCDRGGGGAGAENIVPGTPSRDAWEGNADGIGERFIGYGASTAAVGPVPCQILPQQGMFMSQPMLPGHGDLKETADGDALWESNPCGTAQIWDYNFGRTQGHEEPGLLQVGYGTNTAGFMIETYDELMGETSFTSTEVLEEMYRFNCSSAHKDIASFNNNLHNPAASWGLATSESNNLPILQQSSDFIPDKPRGFTVSNDNSQIAGQTILPRSDSWRTIVTTKADMDLLAQHRGNAMLRYKEKKKTRRYDNHVRYESRKARADTRKRVQGRFVKATEAPNG